MRHSLDRVRKNGTSQYISYSDINPLVLDLLFYSHDADLWANTASLKNRFYDII
jgi:hypothetical protein